MLYDDYSTNIKTFFKSPTYSDYFPKKDRSVPDDSDNFNYKFICSHQDVFNTPLVNIYEYTDNYKIEVFAPKINKDKLNIEVKDNTLYVTYKDEDSVLKEKDFVKMLRKDFSSINFSYFMPTQKDMDLDLDKIKASYKDNIIHITINKLEKSKPIKINVE